MSGIVYVAGTCDTKAAELGFVRERIRDRGVAARLIDLSTTAPEDRGADIASRTVAACHPDGEAAVFGGDRGAAVAAMGEAFARLVPRLDDLGGLIGLGGSGGTAMVTAGMRALPVGTPKLMVSTVASGAVGAYVGGSDIMMMHSVTDIAGLNRISRRVLANAADAMAGMARGGTPEPAEDDRPAVGLTMFGVTTALVERLADALAKRYEPLVFHATGTGGMSMEKLVDSGLVAGVIDATTTEVCDLLMGGIFPATGDRLGAIARTGVPYVGSCGALDMVNFAAPETVPKRYRGRLLYRHNPQVTLMRTTAEECAAIGAWIGERLNRCAGPVRFLIPEGGVSALDAPGMAFHDPEADAALFDALEASIVRTPQRRVERLPHHINDPEFAAALLAAFAETMREY